MIIPYFNQPQGSLWGKYYVACISTYNKVWWSINYGWIPQDGRSEVKRGFGHRCSALEIRIQCIIFSIFPQGTGCRNLSAHLFQGKCTHRACDRPARHSLLGFLKKKFTFPNLSLSCAHFHVYTMRLLWSTNTAPWTLVMFLKFVHQSEEWYDTI